MWKFAQWGQVREEKTFTVILLFFNTLFSLFWSQKDNEKNIKEHGDKISEADKKIIAKLKRCKAIVRYGDLEIISYSEEII